MSVNRLLNAVMLVLLMQLSFIFAQREAAVPFLMIDPLPRLNGMAGAFTALPTNDPHGQYYNPAQLGNFSIENNFALALYTPRTNWLPRFNFSDLTYKSTALAFGYNLKNSSHQIPIHIGMGFVNTKLDLGENIYIDENGNEIGSFRSQEYYIAYSIGIGIDYYIRFNLGYGFKKICSDLPGISAGLGIFEVKEMKVYGHDLGMQLTIPTISIYEELTNNTLVILNQYTPHADFSFGYSVVNIGDKVVYISPLSDPLPRSAQMGLAFSLGMDMDINEIEFTLFDFDWSGEGRDLLINGDADSWQYTSPPGNINFWNNVINGNTNNGVVVHRGWRMEFLDFVEISHGQTREDIRYGTYNYKTSGYRFSSKGLVKLLKMQAPAPIIDYLADHIELSYAHSSYKTATLSHPLNNTKFDGVTIALVGY